MARGVSLEELSRTTRVGQGYLQALEAGEFEKLPAPVFTKGFIRAYCVALAEPADEALSRYREFMGSAPAEPALALTLRPKSRGRGPVLVSLVLLVALGLGLFVLTLGLQGRLRGPAAAQRATPLATKSAAPAAAKPPGPVEPSRARLVARATEQTWVRVKMDDGTVLHEGLLLAGATREWVVSTKRFVLTVGNAGGLTLELNGQPIPSLGARGAVIQNLVIPAEAEGAKP